MAVGVLTGGTTAVGAELADAVSWWLSVAVSTTRIVRPASAATTVYVLEVDPGPVAFAQSAPLLSQSTHR
jgi:hypothetical protein